MKEFLQKLLTVIEYKDDKDAFIDEFIGLCVQKTLSDYLDSLSEEEKKLVTQEMLLANDKYAKLFQKNLEEQLKSYLQEIMPTLSEQQIGGVTNLLMIMGPQDTSVNSSS